MRKNEQVRKVVHICIGIALLPVEKAEEGFKVMIVIGFCVKQPPCANKLLKLSSVSSGFNQTSRCCR